MLAMNCVDTVPSFTGLSVRACAMRHSLSSSSDPPGSTRPTTGGSRQLPKTSASSEPGGCTHSSLAGTVSSVAMPGSRSTGYSIHDLPPRSASRW